MQEFDWGKTLVAVVTPMHEDGSVNYPLAAELCRHIVDQGCDGVVLSGTTGESSTLSPEEKLTLFSEVKSYLGQKGLVVAGVGCNSTASTAALIEKAEKISVDGYMVITPYYNKPNTAGLVEHYRVIDQVSSRPIMVYNVPSRTGLDIKLNEYEQIFTHCPQVTSVKEASTDMEKASELVNRFGRQIQFFSGNDSYLLPLLALGFKGVVSVAANIAPGDMSAIANETELGNWQKAREIHAKLLPLFQSLFVETNPVPVKAALELQGWPVGEPRLPLAVISEANLEKLKMLLPIFMRKGL